MSRPDYIEKYNFDWELFDVVIGGKSALDAHSFLGPLHSKEQAYDFLDDYGFNQTDPVQKAEIFGTFQEALQFIRRYFLSGDDGLNFQIPNSLFTITEVSELFLMANNRVPERGIEENIWAGIVLKVMHTILHADKDLRHNYFSVIQQQIFDRFYKFVKRDSDKNLYLQSKNSDYRVPLFDFETKAKKSRDSIIIKMLHKTENVAEELFDRIGVRFLTHTRFDALRVVKFLQDHHIVIAHNLKASRSNNSLIDLDEFRRRHKKILKMCFRNDLSEERFIQALEREALECEPGHSKQTGSNRHSSSEYKSIHFTSRQLITYKNPFLDEFKSVRAMAKDQKDESELAKKIMMLDLSALKRELRFFFPYEVQISDVESHKKNTEGMASHAEYKNSQRKTAMKRLFEPLLHYKNISESDL
ncbi:MAG: TIGR04552 family protein [Bacteriovoracaceae bacterium]|jgi:uncharacterized protein (TIGR04562 family)|nr:TIGR04552 family protein [Bacteriovoracaceae bacterium]